MVNFSSGEYPCPWKSPPWGKIEVYNNRLVLGDQLQVKGIKKSAKTWLCEKLHFFTWGKPLTLEITCRNMREERVLA